MNLKDPKDPAESVVLGFNFSSELGTILSATVTVSVVSGVDSTPSAVLVGAHQLSGEKVLQRFGNGVAGVLYKFRVVATDGVDTIVRTGIAEVRVA